MDPRLVDHVRAHPGFAAAQEAEAPRQPLWQAVVITVTMLCASLACFGLPFVVTRNREAAYVFMVVVPLVFAWLWWDYMGKFRRRRGEVERRVSHVADRAEEVIRIGRSRGSRYFVHLVDESGATGRFEVWRVATYEAATPGSAGVALFRGGELVGYVPLVLPG